MATYGLGMQEVLEMPTKTAFELYRQTATIAYRQNIHLARLMQLYVSGKAGKPYPIEWFLEPFAHRPTPTRFASSVATDLVDALDLKLVSQACLEILGGAEVDRLYTQAMRERERQGGDYLALAQRMGLEVGEDLDG